ncbi:hypothetical protein BC830DRAFT_1172573 [Chytriomyces sp. MP71]|nr:hypothetical protein BC830DRAFT_1172573 [Chytriomyces sp. MP71]
MFSQITWINGASKYIGLVTFATLLVMVNNDNWKLNWTPKSLCRWMVYFDALAFVCVYVGQSLTTDATSCETTNLYYVIGDGIWSLKDACKYAFIVHKSCVIANAHVRQRKRLTFVSATCSLLIYWIYMYGAYSFVAPCPGNMEGVVWPQALLYAFWTFVEISASVVVLRKFYSIIAQLKDADMEHAQYRMVKVREEFRLLISCTLMVVVTVFQVARALNPMLTEVRIAPIVFVYVQLLLVLGSQMDPGMQSRETQQLSDSIRKAGNDLARASNHKISTMPEGLCQQRRRSGSQPANLP